MMILIKVSDISNEARPMEVAEPWLDCLLQEFYNQVTEPCIIHCLCCHISALIGYACLALFTAIQPAGTKASLHSLHENHIGVNKVKMHTRNRGFIQDLF